MSLLILKQVNKARLRQAAAAGFRPVGVGADGLAASLPGFGADGPYSAASGLPRAG